jgi:hypothetical protein
MTDLVKTPFLSVRNVPLWAGLVLALAVVGLAVGAG